MLDHKGRANLSRKHTKETQVHLSSILPQASTSVQKVSWDTEQLPIWETWLPLDNSEQFYQLTDWQKHPHHDLQMKRYMPRSSSPWANLDRQRPVVKKFQDVVLNLAKTKDSSSHTSDFDKGTAVQQPPGCWPQFFHGRRHEIDMVFVSQGTKNTKLLLWKPKQLISLRRLAEVKVRDISAADFLSFTMNCRLKLAFHCIGGQLEVTTVSTWKKRKQLVMRQIHDAPLTLAMLHPTRIYNPIILIETSLNRPFRCSQQQMFCQSERNPINLTPNVAEPRGLLMVSLATLETSMLEWSDSPIRPMICKTPRTVIHNIPILYA